MFSGCGGLLDGFMQSNLCNHIASVEWAKESIEALADKGVLNGKGDGKFAPNDSVTREEFVTMLIRATGIASEESEKSFTDVPSDAWFYNSVQTAAAKGIINGRENGSFGAGENITRQDMAVIVYNMASKGLLSILLTDASIPARTFRYCSPSGR